MPSHGANIRRTMKTIVSEIDKINHAAAEHIAELLKRKPDGSQSWMLALTWWNDVR